MFWSALLSDRIGSAEHHPQIVAVDTRIDPAACQSMPEVRQGVDALDRALVALLAERQRYMDAAARIKPNRDAVFDQARIDDVVAKVLVSAETHHLSPEIAEPVWRLLIDRCIAHEFSIYDRTRS